MPIVATDPFKDQIGGGGVAAMDWPISREVLVVPNDVDELVEVSRGIYINGAGTLHYLNHAGGEFTKTLVPGMYHPIRVRKVFTNSTATGITAGY